MSEFFNTANEEVKLEPGEIAANLLNDAKDIKCLVAAWVNSKNEVKWYKMGSSLTAIGLLHSLGHKIEQELVEDEEENDDPA